MKIFILSPLALENGRGGEISSMELASGLNKFYDVTIFDTNRYIGERLLSKEAIEKKLNGLKRGKQVKFATMKLFNKNFNFPLPGEVFELFKEIKKNDIVYSSIGNFKIDLMLTFFSLIHRKSKFIIGYRKPLYSDKIFSLYNVKYRLSILYLSLFKKRLYHHALSHQAKKFLEKFFQPNKVIHIIHGVKLNDYVNNKIEEESKDILRFSYIGFLDAPHKGVDVLLNGIRQLLEENKNLKLFFEFCGIGPLTEKVKRLEKEYPKFVKYHGYISNELISKYYKRSDVFLFSSRREPFPRAIMEALAAKSIIICSKTIGSIEILKDKKFGFFVSKFSPEGFKEKIKEVYDLWIKNPAIFKEIQELGQKFVFKNYSVSKEIENFKFLIDKITKD